MRLIGYIRVSTDEQARNGVSLEVQRRQFASYCDLYGHELVDVVEDAGVSASRPLENRPGGADLLARLKVGQADGVLVQRLDRLFRMTIDGLMTFAWFDRRGLTVHSIGERLDTVSPEGKLALTVMLAVAEFERNKTAQRNREVSHNLREAGRTYGNVPFGLVAVDGELFRCADTWPVRERIVAMKACMSYRTLAKRLDGEGIATPSGARRWEVSTLKGLVDTHGHFKDRPWAPLPGDTAVSQDDSADGLESAA